MPKKPRFTERLYGTKQVAKILVVPEWRVKNFAEGKAYALSPTHRVGKGRGSRRLYNTVDVLRLIIAIELVDTGFTPDTVGRALREIPESMLTSWEEYLEPGRKRSWLEQLPLLVCDQGEWRVRKAKDVKKRMAPRFEYHGVRDWGGIFILNFPSLIAAVHLRIENGAAHDKD